MISRVSKILMIFSLLVVNSNPSNCMEDKKNMNPVENININNNISFVEIWNKIKESKLYIEKYSEQSKKNDSLHFSILQAKEKKRKEINNVLDDMKNDNKDSVYCGLYNFNSLCDNNTKLQNAMKQMKNLDKKIKLMEQYMKIVSDKKIFFENQYKKQLQKVYQHLFGPDLSNLGSVLLQSTAHELNSISKILNMDEVKQYIRERFNILFSDYTMTFYEQDEIYTMLNNYGYGFYKDNKSYYAEKIVSLFKIEYDKIKNIINQLNKIQNDIKSNEEQIIENNIKNGVIDMFKQYINERQQEIKSRELKIINLCNEDSTQQNGKLTIIQIQIMENNEHPKINLVQNIIENYNSDDESEVLDV